MKIVVLDGYTLAPGDISWDEIAEQGELTVYDRTPAELVKERIGGAEAVFTNKTPITADVLDACGTMRFIGVLATGYNVVDTQAARARGIPVCNIPTYGTAAVAQFVFAHILELVHPVGRHAAAVRNGEWAGAPDWCFWRGTLTELSGKTIGIVGFGRIGQEVARIAQAFGMRVLACGRSTGDLLCAERVKHVGFGELLRESDIVTLHCPLLEDNREMINRETIAMMKDGAILINTARGPLINEHDLAAALDSCKLSGAGLDVMCTEPPGDMGNPLFKAKNCNITPHIAWAPQESRARLMTIAAENLRAFVRGRPVNVVNP